MSVLIHIGLPKTATTWLQTCVFNNVNDAYFVEPNKNIIQYLSDKSREVDINILKKEYFNTEKNIIYSDPELSGLISFDWNNGENVEIIARRLKSLFPNAKILIILRNQLDFLASGYAYYISKGGTFKFKKYLEKIKNNESGFSLDYLKFHKIIELYNDVFGQKNVHIRLYEELQNNRTSFLNNLSETFSLDIENTEIDYSKKNQRLRRGLMRLIRFFNHFTKEEVAEKNYIFSLPFIYSKLNNKFEYYNYYKCFGSPITTNSMINDELLQFLNNYYKDSNADLSKYLDKELLTKYNYPL